MRKIFISLLCTLVCIALIYSVLYFAKRDALIAIAVKTSWVSETEKSAILSCLSDKKEVFTCEKNGIKYELPLPAGATEFSSSEYPKPEGCIQYVAVNYNYDEFFAQLEQLENLNEYALSTKEFNHHQVFLKKMDDSILFTVNYKWIEFSFFVFTARFCVFSIEYN